MDSINVYFVQPSTHAAGLTWTTLISGIFLLASFVLTYRLSVHVRAGDLLLKLEDAFSKLGSKLAFLEYRKTCYEPVREILRKASKAPDELTEGERQTMQHMDEVIRFLYLCTLHAGDTVYPPPKSAFGRLVRPSRLPQAYYFYLRRLTDTKDRKELCEYIEACYPRLHSWLLRNQRALAAHGAASP
jgi:hypothetical protein